MSVPLQSLVLLPTIPCCKCRCHQHQHAAPPEYHIRNHWLDFGHVWSATCGRPPKDAAGLYHRHGCLSFDRCWDSFRAYANGGGRYRVLPSPSFTSLDRSLPSPLLRCSQFTVRKSFPTTCEPRVSASSSSPLTALASSIICSGRHQRLWCPSSSLSALAKA